MKKIIYNFMILLVLLSFSSCNFKIENNNDNDNDNEGKYYLYMAYSSTNLFEDYFNIEDTKTKIFDNKDDFDNFNNLFNDDFESINDKFMLEINFSINSVAITAIYCDNYNANINLSSLTYDNNTIEQTFVIENTGYDDKISTYGFFYLVIDKDISYEYTFDAIEFQISPFEPGRYVVYKPIIYFYPEKEMELTIKYNNGDRLITTYPKYNDGWTLNLNSDGTFTTLDLSRTYYALYFDELASYIPTFDEGFFVTKDNAINFLEEKLDILGYTEREANEFIMYWLPILENNEKSLVYFETTDIRNNECPLEFSVNPDSMLRVIIHIKKVNEYIDIKEQILPTFNRYGFTIVEWGGISY